MREWVHASWCSQHRSDCIAFSWHRHGAARTVAVVHYRASLWSPADCPPRSTIASMHLHLVDLKGKNHIENRWSEWISIARTTDFVHESIFIRITKTRRNKWINKLTHERTNEARLNWFVRVPEMNNTIANIDNKKWNREAISIPYCVSHTNHTGSTWYVIVMFANTKRCS